MHSFRSLNTILKPLPNPFCLIQDSSTCTTEIHFPGEITSVISYLNTIVWYKIAEMKIIQTSVREISDVIFQQTKETTREGKERQ